MNIILSNWKISYFDSIDSIVYTLPQNASIFKDNTHSVDYMKYQVDEEVF